MDWALQNPTATNIAMAHDLLLRYAEYLDAITINMPKHDPKPILVTVKGVTVKFGNIEQVEDWLADWLMEAKDV